MEVRFSHVLNRSVADLALLREAGGLRGVRADSDVHRQKPALRERPVAKPAGRRLGIVGYPTVRRSPVEADGESKKWLRPRFDPRTDSASLRSLGGVASHAGGRPRAAGAPVASPRTVVRPGIGPRSRVGGGRGGAGRYASVARAAVGTRPPVSFKPDQPIRPEACILSDSLRPQPSGPFTVRD